MKNLDLTVHSLVIPSMKQKNVEKETRKEVSECGDKIILDIEVSLANPEANQDQENTAESRKIFLKEFFDDQNSSRYTYSSPQ